MCKSAIYYFNNISITVVISSTCSLVSHGTVYINKYVATVTSVLTQNLYFSVVKLCVKYCKDHSEYNNNYYYIMTKSHNYIISAPVGD